MRIVLHRRRSSDSTRHQSSPSQQSQIHTVRMEESKFDANLSEFKKKVKRTVCLDHLSPLVNKSVIRSVLGQFETFESNCFVPKHLGPPQSGKCALVEMKDVKQARDIITTMSKHHFMICGMPRPIIAHAAKIGMFENRPRLPMQAALCHWVDRGHPDFKIARKVKFLTETHRAEDAFLLKQQVKEEMDLVSHQLKTLKSLYKKQQALEQVVADRTLGRVASYFGMDLHHK